MHIAPLAMFACLQHKSHVSCNQRSPSLPADTKITEDLGPSRQWHDLRLLGRTRSMQHKSKVVTCTNEASIVMPPCCTASTHPFSRHGRFTDAIGLPSASPCNVAVRRAMDPVHRQHDQTFKGFPAACLLSWNKPATSCAKVGMFNDAKQRCKDAKMQRCKDAKMQSWKTAKKGLTFEGVSSSSFSTSVQKHTVAP